jgi:hypothetical protein
MCRFIDRERQIKEGHTKHYFFIDEKEEGLNM